MSDPGRPVPAHGARTVVATVLAVLAAVGLGACATTAPRSDPPPAGSATLDAFARANDLTALSRATLTLGGDDDGAGGLRVPVLVADTATARARGLMGVTEVPEGVGMLFLFPGPAGPEGRPGFWMLDTPTDLDIAFAADGRVVGVATMRPCVRQPCPITHPGVDYDAAVELRAGTLAGAGITVGARFAWDAR